jgi:putative FmdB family regulatory protein
MPIYEYSCKKCGKTIEAIQQFKDAPLKKHQGCGGALTKLVSASGFQFKGTGWYVTDYARKGKGGDSEGSKDGSAAKDSSDKKESASKSDSTSKDSSKESSKKNSGKSPKSVE